MKHTMLLAGLIMALPAVAQTARGPDSTAHADSLLRAGVACYEGGRYDQAILLIQSSPGPPGAPANYYLGSSFAALNDPQNAVRYLRAAVDSVPGSVPYRFQLAKSLIASGRPGDAREEYRRMLDRDSSFVPALSGLATLLFDARDYRGAARFFAAELMLNPRDYLGCYNLGASLVNIGAPDSARQFLHACLTLNPRFLPAITLLAALYYKRQEYAEAERLYAMAVARDSGNADHWARRGYCLGKLKLWAGAVRCLETAASLDTGNPGYLAHLAQAWFELKQFDSAAVTYLRAGALETDDPVPYLNAGLAWASIDSSEEALAAFRRSYREHHLERLGFLYAQIAGVHYRQKRYREAESAYLRSLAYDPSNARTVFFLAQAQAELRKLGPAASSYRKFLKMASGDKSLADLVAFARKRLRQVPARQ